MSKTTEQATEQATQQFESLFVAPARAYGSLTLEYYEKLMAAQLDAFRTYSDLSLAQARAWIDVKDAEGLKQVVADQQKAVQDLGERLQGDTQKVVTLSQEFLQKGQKLAEENVKSGQKLAEENVKNGQKLAEDAVKKVQASK
ncbi:phasin family protein [Halomonas sp. M5N1S17]|uniref:phasin family protein n=1 Tax=Halomonas alkalisoli TaxID=2907158 RepID=UPI001F413407|nr:phasin family protein [Halomonas alkalisoli]MCE9663109.1 phasin family protein [Halomonas alkalisoli]